ncbi:hypothetical protein V9K67_23235 [Paraflavisolibacter sp. H34]|uniref:hypothetical protein n=1 Tax=Huijunlia imazamoxiresistens TaxID=3127457 RepID=UPI00301A1A3E
MFQVLKITISSVVISIPEWPKSGEADSGNAYFLTLYLNREFAEKEVTADIFVIKETGNLAKGKGGSCRSPYVMIDFYGCEKQLVFDCEYQEIVHDYKKVKLDYFKGVFGFPVVQSQTLLP